MSPKPTLPTCLAETEDDSNVDKAPLVSSEYQQRVKSQKHESTNLIRNPNLLIQEDNSIPDGYTPNIENKSISYTRQQDPDGLRYLQVTSTNDMYMDNNTQVDPGWITDPADVKNGQTYTYGFDYRAEVPVQVQLELRSGDTVLYQNTTELPPSKQWKNFTAHYLNTVNINSMRMVTSIKKPGGFDTKNYAIYKIGSSKLDRGGVVTVAFDDGWQSFYTKAFPLFQSYQMPTTQFIVSDFSDKKMAGYMNFDEITKLKQAGNEIGSHSLRHCDQAKMSQREVANDTVQSKNILSKHSLGPARIFAYPHGSYTASTQQTLEPEYDLIRTSDAGYNDRYFDRTNIRAMSVMSTTTNREFESWLQYASDNNVWLVLTYHRVDETGEYSSTSKQIKDQLELIKKSKLRVMTLTDAARAASNNN